MQKPQQRFVVMLRFGAFQSQHAGQCIGMTGGHVDEHDIPLHVINSLEYESSGTLCDGVPDCLKAVRAQLRRQADVIKVALRSGPAALRRLTSSSPCFWSMAEALCWTLLLLGRRYGIRS